MDEKDNFDANAALPRPHNLAGEIDARERRELLVMKAGGHLISIFADEADGIAEGLVPTPLPHAPPAVRGVVCMRGRMLTVLDPLVLLAESNTSETGAMRHFIVALRGDEQLALAVERIERTIEISAEMVQPLEHARSFKRGAVQYEEKSIVVLNPQEISGAAMQGKERRRQRTFRGE